jgi:CRP-like cAMP-binding protein
MASIQNRIVQHPHLWERLEPLGTLCSFRRNSFVYTPNQAAQSLYLLQDGHVSLQMLSSEGRVLTLQVIEPGQMFGHSALTGNPTYDTFAEAIKTVHAFAIPRDQIFQVLVEQPALGLSLLDIVGRYRLTVSRRLDEVAFKSVPARLASLLLDMANTDTGELELHLPRHTHQQLAEMINTYRETVTKVINQFRAARLVDIDRSGITILNTSRLRELAQG